MKRSILLLALSLGTVACGDYGGGSSGGGTGGVVLASASGSSGGVSTNEMVTAFSGTVYPLLRDYCADCHAGAGPGTPHIAHADPATAYAAVWDNQKVNLTTPETSRLVRRLVTDFHHCWSDCIMDGAQMQAAIVAWDAMVEFDAGGGTDVDGLTSTSLTLADGFEDEGQERYQENLIALWEFREGSGGVAADTSGVAPAMDLSLEGPTLMSSYGIDIVEGRAIASRDASRKLFDRIASPETGSQQYSVEAWVTPANTTQEGPARIVSYSSGTNNRNFTLGQVLYTYDFRNRSLAPDVGNNGTPTLQTYDADEDLQATLQHVVITFDQYRGRRIYVNGRWTDDVDEQGGGRLWTWSPDYRFVLGNETTNNRPWEGRIQLAAVYDVALTDAQIEQNFEARVGKRLILRFDVSQWAGPGSYVEFVVSELDDFSYLFCEPTLVSSNPNGFRVSNLRISVNDQIPVSGQAFVNVDTNVLDGRQILSEQCSVVPKTDPDSDVFAIEFELLAGFQNPVVVDFPPPAPPTDFGDALPLEGMRTFARLNESMGALTGVEPDTGGPSQTFADLTESLPSSFDLRSFASSHQVAISKLALEYCDRLVESPTLRQDFFGAGFDFNAAVPTAFATPADRDAITGPLTDRLLNVNVANQPDRAEVMTALDDLIVDLTAGCDAATCAAERTRSVVKGACAAVLASAGVTVH